jgi:hypothetical protein
LPRPWLGERLPAKPVGESFHPALGERSHRLRLSRGVAQELDELYVPRNEAFVERSVTITIVVGRECSLEVVEHRPRLSGADRALFPSHGLIVAVLSTRHQSGPLAGLPWMIERIPVRSRRGEWCNSAGAWM